MKQITEEKRRFNIVERIGSFKYALHGLGHLFRNEHNARIHIIAGVFAIFFSWYLGIDRAEWLAIILCIGIVLITEIINTSIEKLCDYVSPGYHNKIKIIKDLAAAAVLIGALVSVIIAGCIFVPRLLAIL